MDEEINEKVLTELEFEKCEGFRKDFEIIAHEERALKRDIKDTEYQTKILQLQIQNLEIVRLKAAKRIDNLKSERDRVKRRQREFGELIKERLDLKSIDFGYDSETWIVTE